MLKRTILTILLTFAVISGVYLRFFLFVDFEKLKSIDTFYANLVYESYVNHYLEIPSTGGLYREFYLQLAINQGKGVDYVLNNPVIKNDIIFVTFTDSLLNAEKPNKVDRIRALIRPENTSKAKTENFVSIDNFTFFDYLLGNRTIVLFENYAYTCGGRRDLKFFSSSGEPIELSSHYPLVIGPIKKLLKNSADRRNLSYGTPEMCYRVKASFSENTINFDVECFPTDSVWVNDYMLARMLDTLRVDFQNLDLWRNNFYIRFPLIVKNTTLDTRLNVDNQFDYQHFDN
jgi:hypothetical protein